MNKNELNSYINCYKTKMPRRSNVVIHVKGENFKKMKDYLNKPFDNVFNTLMIETMKTMSQKIEGCFYGFSINNDFVFLLHNDSGKSPYFENDIQKIVSYVSSQISTTFYRLFLAFNVEYEDKISNLEDNNEDIDTLNERLKNLWAALSEIPTFSTEVFTLPDEEEFVFIEKLQDENIDRTINQMSKMFMEKTEGITNKVILRVLEKKDADWYRMPHDYKFGSGFLKRNVDGKTIWTENLFMGEKAERYSKK